MHVLKIIIYNCRTHTTFVISRHLLRNHIILPTKAIVKPHTDTSLSPIMVLICYSQLSSIRDYLNREPFSDVIPNECSTF
ncbi:hypothetical protein GC097_14310 [Paenibacillus sp. LMG 31457]|uniref:Uncharacterized protein n=1 Tax=Paenibacillus planticolens TaxID=2654976 RepID=A0ABX1ZM96_9BACL|nr:hypothetical protein [Paenibacillus planticolens]